MAAAKKTTTNTNGFDAMSVNTEAFKENFEKMNKSFEQMADFQKESLDAMMSAASSFAGNIEKMSSEQTEFTKSAFDEGMKAAKAIAACKSPQEALDVNTEFFRTAFERNMAQFNKMTEMLMSTSKDAVEPLTDSYNHFVEKVQSYRP